MPPARSGSPTGGSTSLLSITGKSLATRRRCSGRSVEVRRPAAEGAGACAEPAPCRAAEGTKLRVTDQRGDVGKLERALQQIAMGQTAPRVVEQAVKRRALCLETAVQTAWRQAKLLGDVLRSEAPLLQAADHEFADAVKRMVDGLLPLDLILAIPLHELEQLRVGIGHGQ